MRFLRNTWLAFTLLILFTSGKSVNRNHKLALKLYQKGDYPSALNKVNLAIAQEKSSETMWLKGHILAAMENYRRAVFFLEYKLTPETAPDENLTALGDSYYELGNYELAKKYYLKIREPGVKDYNNLGVTYFNLNDGDSAIYFLTKVIEMDSTKATAYFGRAIIFKRELRMGFACRDYQKACELGMADACEELEKQNCLS